MAVNNEVRIPAWVAAVILTAVFGQLVGSFAWARSMDTRVTSLEVRLESMWAAQNESRTDVKQLLLGQENSRAQLSALRRMQDEMVRSLREIREVRPK